MLIARFEGMYYRNDWPDKFPDGYWVPTLRYYRDLPVNELQQENIVYVGTNFEYHRNWIALFDAWLKFQTKYQDSYPKSKMTENEHFKQFTEGIAQQNLMASWKGLVKACHKYLELYNI